MKRCPALLEPPVGASERLLCGLAPRARSCLRSGSLREVRRALSQLLLPLEYARGTSRVAHTHDAPHLGDGDTAHLSRFDSLQKCAHPRFSVAMRANLSEDATVAPRRGRNSIERQQHEPTAAVPAVSEPGRNSFDARTVA